MLESFMSSYYRELYYRDVELTGSQQNVNEAIKIICRLLQVNSWEMGVFSSSKGLMAGSVEILLADDSQIDCRTHSEGNC